MAFPPEPRTPASALAYFLVGCAVIVATSRDVARRLRDNERPVAAESVQELQAYKAELDKRAAYAALRRAGGGGGGDGGGAA
jgi:hypothetical protein